MQHFMLSHSLKLDNPEDVQEAKAILDGFRDVSQRGWEEEHRSSRAQEHSTLNIDYSDGRSRRNQGDAEMGANEPRAGEFYGYGSGNIATFHSANHYHNSEAEQDFIPHHDLEETSHEESHYGQDHREYEDRGHSSDAYGDGRHDAEDFSEGYTHEGHGDDGHNDYSHGGYHDGYHDVYDHDTYHDYDDYY